MNAMTQLLAAPVLIAKKQQTRVASRARVSAKAAPRSAAVCESRKETVFEAIRCVLGPPAGARPMQSSHVREPTRASGCLRASRLQTTPLEMRPAARDWRCRTRSRDAEFATQLNPDFSPVSALGCGGASCCEPLTTRTGDSPSLATANPEDRPAGPHLFGAALIWAGA